MIQKVNGIWQSSDGKKLRRISTGAVGTLHGALPGDTAESFEELSADDMEYSRYSMQKHEWPSHWIFTSFMRLHLLSRRGEQRSLFVRHLFVQHKIEQPGERLPHRRPRLQAERQKIVPAHGEVLDVQAAPLGGDLMQDPLAPSFSGSRLGMMMICSPMTSGIWMPQL